MRKTRLFLSLPIVFGIVLMLQTKNQNRIIQEEITIPASVNEVWDAWTTQEGIITFFAPACSVNLRIHGEYEIYFDPDAEEGRRGGEGNRILDSKPDSLFSFTWNAPPSMPLVRNERTQVILNFHNISKTETRLILTHKGWGEGKEWDEAYDYFINAWGNIVLPRLKYRFETGPVDWNNPPRFEFR